MKTILFLDLEDTVITPVINGWANTQMINTDKLRALLLQLKPTEVGIFSFAIWNEFELRGFNHGTRPMLERFLGHALTFVPTVDDQIIPAACSQMKLSPDVVEFSDMSDFWGKQQAFRLCVRNIFKNRTKLDDPLKVVLLDDVVFDETFHWPDLNLTGQIINIDTFSVT